MWLTLFDQSETPVAHPYVAVGGWIIIDDWEYRGQPFPAKDAVLDFLKVHSIEDPEIQTSGSVGAFFKKTKDVQVQHWRYEKGGRRQMQAGSSTPGRWGGG